MTTRVLQIYDKRERLMVQTADALLGPLAWFRGRRTTKDVERVLLLRLERIGDLLMTIEAIRGARKAWPNAEIDLAVGSWNAPLAAMLPEVTRVEVLSVPWLARGERGLSWPALVKAARSWRRRHYDLVVNFEPDIRSNLFAWLTGARERVGYSSGGGGAFLTSAAAYDPTTHVSTNARRLIARATGVATVDEREPGEPRLRVATTAQRRVGDLLHGALRPFIGIHASGGRESKQWHLDRFAEVGRSLVQARGGTVVLTGSAADRPLVDTVKQHLGDTPVIDAAVGLELAELAALLRELDVLVTGDTGPMHLAAAVGTPVVALFGPSNPLRYGPRAAHERIIRVDLPCSPCGQVRLPPERCRGHVPDCLNEIDAVRVVEATLSLLDEVRLSGPSRQETRT